MSAAGLGGRLARWGVVALVGVAAAGGCGLLTTVDEAELARGEELYQANCVDCHGGPTGGDIADVPPPHNAEGHTWHHPDCELVEIVLEGMPPRLGYPEMPAFGDRLDEADTRAILVYIKTWWEPDQQAFQEQVTEQAC